MMDVSLAWALTLKLRAKNRHTVCFQHYKLQESLANAKVSARQQCVYKGP